MVCTSAVRRIAARCNRCVNTVAELKTPSLRCATATASTKPVRCCFLCALAWLSPARQAPAQQLRRPRHASNIGVRAVHQDGGGYLAQAPHNLRRCATPSGIHINLCRSFQLLYSSRCLYNPVRAKATVLMHAHLGQIVLRVALHGPNDWTALCPGTAFHCDHGVLQEPREQVPVITVQKHTNTPKPRRLAGPNHGRTMRFPPPW